jgi:ABC-type transport system substrate-binding protein
VIARRFAVLVLAATAFAPALWAAEIHIAIPKPPAYYDPRRAADSVTHGVISQVYESSLLYTSSQPNGAPNLLTGVRRVDPKTYVGTVVPNIQFSDGSPLTAAAMVQWLATVPDISSRASVSAGRGPKGETVTFHLKEPDQYFATLLMMNYSAIAKETAKGVFVGTGPFVLASHDDKQIVLTKNPHFHDAGLPKTDRLVFQVYPAEADGTNPKLMAAISRGEVDFTESVPISSLPQVQTMKGVKAVVLDSKNTGWVSFNTRKAPVNDVRLRRALAYLLPSQAIVKQLYPVGTRVATSFLPPALASQIHGVDFDMHAKFDPALGKSELSAMGYTAARKLKLVLLVPWASRPYCNNPILFGEIVKKSFEDTGMVEVKVNHPRTGDEYFQDLLGGKFEIAANGWIADGPNPVDFVEANFESSKINCLSNCNNMAQWANPKVDAAIRQIRATGTPAGFQTIVDEIRREVPLLPIVHGPGVMVFSTRIHGVEPSVFSYLSFRAAYVAGS